MKTFNRTSLPSSITYNNRVFKPCHDGTTTLCLDGYRAFNSFVSDQKASGKKCIMVNVLSRNLKSRTDLHGKLYQPSQWLFISE